MPETADQLVPRRTFVKVTAGAAGTLALATSGVAVAGSLTRRAPATLPTPSITPSEAAAAVAGPQVETFGLSPGQVLGRWEVTGVLPVREGAIAVGMRTSDGVDFQVDVVRRESGHRGLENTRYFSVFLVNNGTGDTASDEEQGCGAIMLGRYLGVLEEQGLKPPAQLLSFNGRRAAFPAREAGRRTA